MSELELPDVDATERRSPLEHRWAPLALLMAGTFVIVLDFFIVNVAVPAIELDLHASAGQIEWVVAGYGLSFAIALVTAGRLGDAYGRRRILSIGFAGFAAASAVCGAATGPEVLIAARVAQGLAGALLSANVLAIIGVTYTGRDRVRAISVYGLVMGLAAVGGQLAGGALIAADGFGLGWRWVFLINVPVGAGALLLAPRVLAEPRTEGSPQLDGGGVVLLALALAALLVPLIEGRESGWPWWAWTSLGLSPLVFAAFASHQVDRARQDLPVLLDVRLFRERAFAAGLATQLALWCGQASFFLVLALYLQQGRGLSALASGLVLAILASAYLAASLRAPALTLRHGRRLVGGGAVVLAAGHAALAATVAGIGTAGHVLLLAPGLLLVGAGMGLCITPLTTTVLASATAERAGAVSGTLSTMQQLGNSLGVAVTGVVYFGALASGAGRAFELSAVQLAALLLVVAGLSRLLRSPES